MSIKVYHAFEVDTDNLPKVIQQLAKDDFERQWQMWDRVKTAVKKRYPVEEALKIPDINGKIEHEAAQEMERLAHHLNNVVSIYFYNNKAYVIPDFSATFNPDKYPDCQEHSYWDSTDPPEWARDYEYEEDPEHPNYGDIKNPGPGYQKWSQRRQTWHDIFYNKQIQPVTHQIYNWNQPHRQARELEATKLLDK